MYTTKICKQIDIKRIRDFLVVSYQTHNEKLNWLIDRLNFTYSLSRIMNEVSQDTYLEKILIIEKENTITAVVITEGENRGEAFFFLKEYDCDEALIKLMFDFVEEHLMKIEGGRSYVNLRIQREAHHFICEAIKRGFVKEDWTEVTSKKTLTERLKIDLPVGYKFSIQSTPESKAIAHANAFGYQEKQESVKRCVIGMTELTAMIDYDQSLDIQVLDQHNQIAAFCTMWFDEVNKIGVLEPVGTHPDHRRKGLAKAAIFEACNKIYARGASSVYVGSDQKFYKAIGFSEITYDDVYKKIKYNQKECISEAF